MRWLRGMLTAVIVPLFLSSLAAAQDLEHFWSRGFGNAAEQHGVSVCVDPIGNTAITGYFWGTIDFGGGPLTAVGNVDFFVARFDPAGNHLWSRSDGNAVDLMGLGVATDGAGNVVVTGEYLSNTAPLDLGGGPLAPPGRIFVVKYAPDGSYLWGARHGGSEGRGYGVAVDGANRIVVTGYFGGVGDLGGATLASVGYVDAFLAKYEPGGGHLWSRLFSGAGTSASGDGRSVAVDADGDIALVGDFVDSINLGGGMLAGGGLLDVFFAGFDPNGNHRFSRAMGDGSFQGATGVAVDAGGNAVITGGFQGVMNAGGAPLVSAGDYDVFLAKYGPTGAHIWSRRFGSTLTQIAAGVATDGVGNILCTGSFEGGIDFGGGLLTSAHADDVYLARLRPDGTHLWSRRFGGQQHQRANGVAAMGSGRTFIAGVFQGSTDFGGGPLVSAGSYDVFLAALEPDDAMALEGVDSAAPASVRAYPSPADRGTMIRFVLAEPGRVEVAIFGADGRLVRDLGRNDLAAGEHRVPWDRRDDHGCAVAAGSYFCRVSTDGRPSAGARVVVTR